MLHTIIHNPPLNMVYYTWMKKFLAIGFKLSFVEMWNKRCIIMLFFLIWYKKKLVYKIFLIIVFHDLRDYIFTINMKTEAKVHTIMLSKGLLHINVSKVNFIRHESWMKSCKFHYSTQIFASSAMNVNKSYNVYILL